MRISDWSSDVCSSDLPAADRAIVAIDGAAHVLFDIVSKRFQPFLSLKTDNIISEEGFHQRPMMRQRHEQTRRRPGNMQEKADAIGQATVAQHLPKRNHVVSCTQMMSSTEGSRE